MLRNRGFSFTMHQLYLVDINKPKNKQYFLGQSVPVTASLVWSVIVSMGLGVHGSFSHSDYFSFFLS